MVDSSHATVPDGYRASVAGLILNFESRTSMRSTGDWSAMRGLEPRLELRSEAFGQRHFILADPSAGIVGLSERWREEGLGRVRGELAKQPPAPTVFVRRGARPGGLAPAETRTRFSWSMAGASAA